MEGHCNHAAAELTKNTSNNAIGMYCRNCQMWVTKAVGYNRDWLSREHPALASIDISSLPQLGINIYRRCQGPCNSLARCHLHHTAPRALFGDFCDDWPMVWLCQSCHTEWHRLVTPGLCTAYNPDDHAKQLIVLLKLDKAILLAKSLWAQLK